MEGVLSQLTVYIFVAVGCITTILVLLRWLLKELGKFIKFFRRWKNDTFPPDPVDNRAHPLSIIER